MDISSEIILGGSVNNQLQSRISIGKIEALLTFITGKKTYPRLQIFRFRNISKIDPGVDWRLVNFISFLRKKGVDVHVYFDGEQGASVEDPAFNLVAKSALGYYISKYCSEIYFNNNDVRDDMEKLVDGWKQSSKIFYRDNLHIRSDLPLDSVVEFDEYFKNYILNRVEGYFGTNNKDHDPINHLSGYCYEAIQNVYDHANDKRGGDSANSISEVESFIFIEKMQHLSIAERTGVGELGRFIEDHQWTDAHRSNNGYLRIVIIDNGVGISARHSMNSNIYNIPVAKEVAEFNKAITAGESVKIFTLTDIRGDPGYGMSQIINSVKKLYGYALIRTGRITAVINAARKFNVDNVGLDVSTTISAFPGTCIEFILPIPDREIYMDFKR